MDVNEFSALYPQYAFDFTKPLKSQLRIHAPFQLDRLPLELEPTHAYRPGSRGRPNLNQSLTHSQCASCKRVLRNDFFYVPPSQLRKNLVHTHCRNCTRQLNAHHYETSATLIRARRIAIWKYLAPSCAVCGFDKDSSALDMHHLLGKDLIITELITTVAFDPDSRSVERLLREAAACIPLCSNCHRMVHAEAMSLPTSLPHLKYRLSALLQTLNALGATSPHT